MNDEEAATPLPRTWSFEAIGLRVGSRLQLVLVHDGGQPRHYTNLIGYVPGKYILIQPPQENGLPVPLREHEELTIRVFSGTEVFSFRTAVEHVVRTPFFCVYLAYPEDVEGTRLRTAFRVQVQLPVEISCVDAEGNKAQVAGFLTDLSSSGARVDCERKLGEPGTSIGLSFAFVAPSSDAKVQVDVPASIRSVGLRQPPPAASDDSASLGESFQHGVQFENLSSDQQIVLQNFLYETLISDRRKLV